MQTFVTSQRGQWWLIGAAVLGLILFIGSLALLMVPYSQQIEAAGGADLTCLQIPFTRARAASLIDTYNQQARRAAIRLHLPGDMIFPVGYALLYGGLVGLVARRCTGWWQRTGLIVMFFPAGAALLDVIENLHIIAMINAASAGGTQAIPALLPLTGSLAGTLKYLLLSGLAPLWGLAAIGVRVLQARGKLSTGAWVTFAVAGLLLAASLVMSVGSVRACVV